jgi:hypothetical protein
MEQSPSWEANRFAASQEIPCILWNPKVHYRIHNNPPPVPIRSQLDIVVHPSLFSHLRLGFPSCLFLSGFPTKTLYSPLLFPIRATYPVHFNLLDLITQTIFCEQYRSLSPHYVVFSTSLTVQHNTRKICRTRGKKSTGKYQNKLTMVCVNAFFFQNHLSCYSLQSHGLTDPLAY